MGQRTIQHVIHGAIYSVEFIWIEDVVGGGGLFSGAWQPRGFYIFVNAWVPIGAVIAGADLFDGIF